MLCVGRHMARSCRFILKTDDDAFVNVPAFVQQLRLLCESPDCRKERLYMGKQCRRGKVIMSPGHKWDNSGYYNHTGERHFLRFRRMKSTMSARPFPPGATLVIRGLQRTLLEATLASNPQVANLLCPKDAAGLTVLATDVLVTPAQAVLCTSLVLNQKAAFALLTIPILPLSFWWPTTHMPHLA